MISLPPGALSVSLVQEAANFPVLLIRAGMRVARHTPAMQAAMVRAVA